MLFDCLFHFFFSFFALLPNFSRMRAIWIKSLSQQCHQKYFSLRFWPQRRQQISHGIQTQKKRKFCQLLKTNKENHVSRFIRGISSTSQGFLGSHRFDCASKHFSVSFVYSKWIKKGSGLLINRDLRKIIGKFWMQNSTRCPVKDSGVKFAQHSAKFIRFGEILSNFDSNIVLYTDDNRGKENQMRKCHCGNKTSNFILVLI